MYGIPLSICGTASIAISVGMGCGLPGIKLKILSMENGNTRRNPATAQRQYEIIFGAFFSGKRTRQIAAITNAPVRLMFNTDKNN
jgi:hypothetical protein